MTKPRFAPPGREGLAGAPNFLIEGILALACARTVSCSASIRFLMLRSLRLFNDARIARGATWWLWLRN
ncbi:hypothetical protein P3T33_005177 [Rhizobium sp. AN67]|nr:hypothetical protein [Rhizobium sp. AN67]SOD51231.1 hypothetical protein SAMN05216595_0613 [Rhizobium sp. AN6A]